MPHRRHPITGCNPDQLFGCWAIDPEAHQRIVDLCLSIPFEELRARNDAAASGTRADKQKPYDQRGRVAVIPIEGALTKHPTSFDVGSSTAQARHSLRAAVADPEIDRILLHIDSPGGTINGTRDLYEAIRFVNGEGQGKKPVYSHIEDTGGSAAYWIASAGKKITANANAMVGGIGAYTILKDTSGNLERQGIKLHVVSSHKLKGAGAAGTPITDEAKAVIQERVDDTAALFISDVADARRMDLGKVKEIADGRAYIASKAKDLHLIDEIKSFDDVLEELQGLSPASTRIYSGVTTMPLSAETIGKIRASVPGAKEVPDEQLATFAAAASPVAFEQLQAKDTELAALRARLPKQVDPDVLAGQAENVAEKIELKVEAGKISAAQAAILRSAVIPAEGKVNAAMLAKMEDGQRPVDVLLKVIDVGTPTGVAAGEKATTHELKRPTYGGISANGKGTQEDTAALIKQYDEEMKQWIESRLPPQTAAAR